jgi:hypothetical protein
MPGDVTRLERRRCPACGELEPGHFGECVRIDTDRAARMAEMHERADELRAELSATAATPEEAMKLAREGWNAAQADVHLPGPQLASGDTWPAGRPRLLITTYVVPSRRQRVIRWLHRQLGKLIEGRDG